MKKIFFTGCLLLLTATISSAQKSASVPSFSAYRAKVERRAARQPDLASHKNARMFRTNLRNAARDGVNFAGHYVLTLWGCGTNCLEAAIIDGRTGRVFFPGVLQGMGVGLCDLPEDAEPLVYKPDSRLLVLNGYKGGAHDQPNPQCGVYYLEWTGTGFRQVKYVLKKSAL